MSSCFLKNVALAYLASPDEMALGGSDPINSTENSWGDVNGWWKEI
jgi:hypothetical protein